MILGSELVERHRLGDLVAFSGGFSFKSSDWKPSGIPVIKIANVRDGDVNLEGCSFIDHSTAAASADYKVQKGDLLMTLTGEIGAMGIYKSDTEARLNQRLCRVSIKNDKNLLLDYVHYFLSSPRARQSMWLMSKGAAQANISVKDIATLEIPVPPLEEQRRIVETLDDHLSRLDKALAELEHVDTQTLLLRRSILNELLNPESPVSAPGVERMSDGAMLRLKDVAEGGLFCDGDWVESKDQDPNGTIRLLQLADIGDGEFRDKSSRWLRPDQAERIGVTYVEEGDILIARMPDPLGRACIVPKLATPSITAVDVAILRLKREDVDSRWLMWWLNSPQTRATIAALASGTTRQRITRKNLEALDLFLPPIDEQRRIVETLDEGLQRLDSTRSLVASQKASLQTLRRSLLNKAFNGELGIN